jgi:hypothetical protein
MKQQALVPLGSLTLGTLSRRRTTSAGRGRPPLISAELPMHWPPTSDAFPQEGGSKHTGPAVQMRVDRDDPVSPPSAAGGGAGRVVITLPGFRSVESERGG